MRILYLSASIIPSEKANSVHVMKMCESLADENKVTLIASMGENKLNYYRHYNVQSNFKISLIRIKSKKVNSIFRLIRAFLLSFFNDIIYTRWYIGALFMILVTRKKIILEHHNILDSKRKNRIIQHLNKSNKIIKHVFITKALKSAYIKKYNPNNTSNYYVFPDGAEYKAQYSSINIHENMIRKECVYLGSFLPGKGVELVVQIANALPSFTFHIVGGSQNEINQLRNKCEFENVIWHGYLNQINAMKILEQTHIALLPNQNDIYIDNDTNIGKYTSPMKMFEYMSRGKAIIASDLEVLKEVLVNEYNSVLVDPSSTEEWVKGIIRLQRDSKLFNHISNNALQDLKTKYTWKIRAKNVLREVESEI